MSPVLCFGIPERTLDPLPLNPGLDFLASDPEEPAPPSRPRSLDPPADKSHLENIVLVIIHTFIQYMLHNFLINLQR